MNDNNIPDHLKDDISAPYNIEDRINYPKVEDNVDILEDDLWSIDDIDEPLDPDDF